MSRKLLIAFFSASLFAQSPSLQGPARFPSEPPGSGLDFEGSRFTGLPGGHQVVPGVDDPMIDDFNRIDKAPLRIELDRPAAKPISGLVSLRELQHPPQKKAVVAFLEAEWYSRARQIPKAIDKLEQAIRIDPWFRDAHLNLGVQYTRVRRVPEAVGQFHTALEVGPPDAIIYSNLAWGYSALGDFRTAEGFARQAVALDPQNGPAQKLLRLASSH